MAKSYSVKDFNTIARKMHDISEYLLDGEPSVEDMQLSCVLAQKAEELFAFVEMVETGGLVPPPDPDDDTTTD